MITQEKLKETHRYDKNTGLFTRSSDGKIWNNTNAIGYVYLYVDGKSYLSHRMSFLYVYGYIPKEVDHIDHDRSNNKIENLRGCDRLSNGKNLKKKNTNTSGFTGVRFNKRQGKYVARIYHKGKEIFLGYYSTIEEAVNVRAKANNSYGYHKNHGI